MLLDSIRMKCVLVLRLASGKSQSVFKVIDGAFHSRPDFIGISYSAINICHPSAGRGGAEIFTMADVAVFSCRRGGFHFTFGQMNLYRVTPLRGLMTPSDFNGRDETLVTGNSVLDHRIIFVFQT